MKLNINYVIAILILICLGLLGDIWDLSLKEYFIIGAGVVGYGFCLYTGVEK